MVVRISILCLFFALAPGFSPREQADTGLRAAFSALDLPAAAAKPGSYKDPKKDKKFRARVNAAIEGGVKWLLEQQSSSGQFPGFSDQRGTYYELGMHALSTLAVMKGMGDVDAPPVQKALRKLHALYERHRATIYTYEVGLTLMVLDATSSTKPHPFMDKKKARKLLKKKPVKPTAKDLKIASDLVVWIQRKQNSEGLWRYPSGGMDVSNTQYAALGLWSASRMGVDVNKGVVRRMMEQTLARQQKTGPRVGFYTNPIAALKGTGRRSGSSIEAKGWRYMPKEMVKGPDGKSRMVTYPYSGSMTSAGVAILGIGRKVLGAKDEFLRGAGDSKVRRAMWEGLGWIQKNWKLDDNPGQPGNWPFYWIYGLERAARVAGVEFVGLHDWYHEGAMQLLNDQRPNGSWPKRQRMRPKGDQNVRWWSDQVDTAFAILFLTLSTPGVETPPPVITGE